MEEYVKSYGSPTGLTLRDAKDVKEFVKDKGIDSIRLWFTDLLGFLKSFSISSTELSDAFSYGMGFDGSSILGYKRIQESDMVAFPLPETVQLIPFKIGGSRALRMFASIYTPAGEPYLSDSRQILIKNLEKLSRYDFTHMNIGPEAEYFYFANKKEPKILDEAGYFDLNPVDQGDGLREITVFALQSMNIPVEYAHHEVAPSQHEIDLKYKDALTMADNLQTHKWLVKEIAERNGVHATFMPKPIRGENGSGMHIHLSLFRGEKNSFFSQDDACNLSATAKYFLAGIIKHSKEMCLITNQWYNSYKRLVPGFEAPVYIAWAEKNRSVLVRIPVYRKGKESATRIEIRFPDAACNPYLAFSVLLTAGLKGIDAKYPLPEPVNQDLYIMSELERERAKIESLPHGLYAAIRETTNSPLVKEALGEEVMEKLIETKLKEWINYRLDITPREMEENLTL
ncbi:glutamine synthetase [Candidatus Aerophobetes bacterium]|nr:glutamine synthetase [Candidatus Aerophobetes bacterium]